MSLPTSLAPIVLFVYKRPSHTQKTLEALAKNDLAKHSDLYVFSDGPKTLGDAADVQAVRAVVDSFKDAFKTLQMTVSDVNHGLADSIIAGVTMIVEQHGQVIVIEDDIVTTPFFLDYMNQGLEKYKNSPQIGSIHAYMYPVEVALPDTFFIRGADCWGWATWARAWRHFEPNATELIAKLINSKQASVFDLDGAYPFYRMLKNQRDHKISSWAIRWHASLFLRNMLTLYPNQSLVVNIGMDGSGTHEDLGDQFAANLKKTPVTLSDIPLEENKLARRAISKFWIKNQPVFNRIFWRLKTKFFTPKQP